MGERRRATERVLAIMAACIRGNVRLKICVHNQNLWARILRQNSIIGYRWSDSPDGDGQPLT